MSKVSVSANVRATSKAGMTPEKAIKAAKADLAHLSEVLAQDPQSPWMREVGYRLIKIGQYLAVQGRPR